MSLYILNDTLPFVETRSKLEIAKIKSLNQKRIPTVVFKDMVDIPEIFTDPKAVFLLINGINEKNKEYIKICNENNIPVILLHGKKLHGKKNECHKYVYSSISDNEDITASMIYRYFKSNGKEKVAFFGFYPNAESDVTKVNCFYNYNYNFDYEDIFFIKSSFNECMEDYLEHRYNYDGVYFPNDFVAIAFLDYFRENEPSYLENRFFLGCMDTIMARLYPISLTSVTYTFDAVKSAVLQIYRSLTNNKNDFDSISISLKNIIIPRESTQKKALTNSEPFLNFKKRNMTLNFGNSYEEYDHKSDESLKNIFALENLLLNAKPMDLLIIYMYLKGYSNSMIINKLFLVPQSLNAHKNNYFKKVGCKDKNEFIKLASKYISLKHLEEYIQYVSKDITDFSNY